MEAPGHVPSVPSPESGTANVDDICVKSYILRHVGNEFGHLELH